MSPLTYPPCSIADWTPQSYGLLPALPIRGGCLAERRGRMPGRMPGWGWSQRPGGLGPLIPLGRAESSFPVG